MKDAWDHWSALPDQWCSGFVHLYGATASNTTVVLETEYTGPRIKIKGYEIGGKTGTAELIDQEMNKLLKKAYKLSENTIKENFDKLELVTKELLEKENIEKEDFEKLMNS